MLRPILRFFLYYTMNYNILIGLHPACLEYLYSRLDSVITNEGGHYQSDFVSLTTTVKQIVQRVQDGNKLDEAWSVVCGACKGLPSADVFLAQTTALLPYANSDWRVIDRMLYNYSGKYNKYKTVDEFLISRGTDFTTSYLGVWSYAHPIEPGNEKPLPAVPIFKDGDQVQILNFKAFWGK